MKRSSLLCALLCAALFAGSLPADDDHWEAHRLRQSGAILPLETILESLNRVRPGRILELELEQEHGAYIYEIELLDPQGQVWELEIDATSGELLDAERED
jgi:uncharacterized membrane protein YkoI